MRLSDEELEILQAKVGRQYLSELDRRLTDELKIKLCADDTDTIVAHLAANTRDAEGTTAPVGLISMPWMTPSMPSIQLATLSAALEGEGIPSERHELFVDYAGIIGIELFRLIGNTWPFIAEWIFARHYFGPETGDYLFDFWDRHPETGMFSKAREQEVLDVLGPVTKRFLRDAVNGIDWGQYEVLGFSLTTSQLASSLALARLIKKQHPEVTIVFGGACCAGPMGGAILRISPYVDIVVHVEGESAFPEIVRRVRAGCSWIRGFDRRLSANGVQ